MGIVKPIKKERSSLRLQGIEQLLRDHLQGGLVHISTKSKFRINIPLKQYHSKFHKNKTKTLVARLVTE